MERIFEKASRLQLRFATTQGNLTTEDLWELPLTSRANGRANLDDIARTLNKQLKTSGDDISFVTESADKPDEGVQLAFEVVKHIISVRLHERNEAAQAATKAEKKQLLLGLLAGKEMDDLKGLTADELRAKINDL